MGLDISHGAWNGAYSSFMRWRIEIAKAAELPDLEIMEGFTNGDGKPWDSSHPLTPLLNHSDCDGEIEVKDLPGIISGLELLLPQFDKELGGHIGNMAYKTQTFIEGCKRALELNEPLEFS